MFYDLEREEKVSSKKKWFTNEMILGIMNVKERGISMEIELVNAFPVSSVEELGVAKKEISTKPYIALSACLVISVVMMFFSSTMRILGIIVLLLTIYAFVKIPNEKRIVFYETCMVIYPPKQKELCQKIDFDEIIEWVVRQGKTGGDQLVLRLEGDKYIQTESFNSTRIVRFLNTVMPEREANRKRRDESKNTPLRWPWKKN